MGWLLVVENPSRDTLDIWNERKEIDVGSITFQRTIGGRKMLADEGYRELVEEARFNYGNDSYNGSISTTSGFVMVNKGKRRLNTVVRETLKDESSQIRKWGPAGCIELTGSHLTRWRRQHGLAGTRARAYLFFGWAAE